jgi:hypothetical protein
MTRTTTELTLSRIITESARRLRWGASLLALAMAACGNLTAGGFGEAVVVVSGDSPEAFASAYADSSGILPSAAVLDAPSTSALDGPARAEGDEPPEGQIEAELLLYLVSESGAEVSLTDNELELSVDLGGVEQDETLPKEIPVDTYTSLRIVFLQIEVQVDAGLVIGGVPVTGPIDIKLESDSLSVSKPVNLQLDEAERAEILVDLNATSWLQAVDPTTSSVDASVFADLIAVVVR